MNNLRFDEETGKLLPQKVKYTIKHNELDGEIIDKYINNEYNFQIKYDNEGDLRFIKKK